LADGLKYTANMNKKLVDHYHAYPSDPEGFGGWHKVLTEYLGQAYARFQ
jgi:digeranylgeranylglycerophospholipid reductase